MRAAARLLILGGFLLLCPALAAAPAWAQGRDSALSDAEIERLRDAAATPLDRVEVFLVFLDDRTKAIDKLGQGRRRPGREEDIHDQMEQFTSIAQDLEDNLDDYSARHRDVRKVLPKLRAATERWATALKTPPDQEAYNGARKLALETVADLHEQAAKLLEEQKAYFLAHPPVKDAPFPARLMEGVPHSSRLLR